mmetsp:Transcript_9141/g.23162  ORF Transcript_9141/g.23162 Transcript_9141/m.23162 type:complete len:650 (-) Transcript_9141:149-2098(-)
MSDVVDDIIMMPAGEGQHSSEAAAMESCSSSSTSMPVPVPQQQQQQLTAAAAQSIAFASVAAAPQNRSQQAPNVVSPGVQQQQHHQTSGPQIVVHHPLQPQQQQIQPLPAPPMMMLDNIKDVVHVLKRRELTYCNTYSTTANSNNNTTCVDKWRPVMVSWMWSVIDTFSLMPQLVPTGLYFLDMCSSTSSSNILTENGADPATVYPLMAMTALNLAVKVHETKMFPLDQLVLLFGKQGNNNNSSTTASSSPQQQPSKLRYTPKDVVEMEEKILRQCHWQLHPPTPHEFLLQFGLVLPVQYRSQVVIHAQQRVKHASLWDHARGGSSSHTSTPSPPPMEPFLPSTMAYASLLLAMEDPRLNLPLEIKQTTCRALLQVSGLSAHTPRLEEAYNWMILATSLQDQLIQQRRQQHLQQQQQQLQTTSSKTTAAVPATVQKPTAAPPVAQAGPPTAGQSPSPPSGYWRDADSPSSSSSSSSEMMTEQEEEEEDSFDVGVDHDMLSCFGVGAKKSTGNYEDGDDDRTATTVRSSMSSSFSTSSSSSSAVTVIFYSHTKSGDNGFEVTVSGFEDDDDYMIEKSMPAHVIVSPVGPPLHHIEVMDDDEEVHELQLVLSKSLDEDGVEIAMAQKYNLSEGEEHPELSNMIASPRMVNI